MTSCGSYLPERKVSNNDLMKFVNTSDEWIQKRSGIQYRHFVDKKELTSDMATKASEDAINKSNISVNDIDLIILATTTPDNTFPSTASKVQNNLKTKAIAFDIQAVCAGFIYAISVATSMLNSNFGKKCLVIGADSMSKLLNWNDRSTCVLFGDGAGAVILEKFELQNQVQENQSNWGVLSNVIHTDGNYYDLLYTNGGVSLNNSSGVIEMLGKEVYRHAVEKLSSSFLEALKISGLAMDKIDWLIPHQANQRIINAVSEKLNFCSERIISTVSHHGNTSAASIPLALDYATNKKLINDGDFIGFQAIGGGLSWGSSIVRIGKPKNLKDLCL